MKRKKGVAEMQSEYTGVFFQRNPSKSKNSVKGFWRAEIMRDGKRLVRKNYPLDKERDAAKAVDWALIQNDYEPINGIFTRLV
jgi:hypothetical protein